VVGATNSSGSGGGDGEDDEEEEESSSRWLRQRRAGRRWWGWLSRVMRVGARRVRILVRLAVGDDEMSR